MVRTPLRLVGGLPLSLCMGVQKGGLNLYKHLRYSPLGDCSKPYRKVSSIFSMEPCQKPINPLEDFFPSRCPYMTKSRNDDNPSVGHHGPIAPLPHVPKLFHRLRRN